MGGEINNDQNCFKNFLTNTENSINKAGSFCARKLSCLKKAGPTLAKIAIAVAAVLFLWQATIPTLAGILIGVVFKDQVKAVIDRVLNAIRNIPLIGKIVVGIATAAVCVAIPWASGFAFGSYAGSEIHRLTMTPKREPFHAGVYNGNVNPHEAREFFNQFGNHTREFIA